MDWSVNSGLFITVILVTCVCNQLKKYLRFPVNSKTTPSISTFPSLISPIAHLTKLSPSSQVHRATSTPSPRRLNTYFPDRNDISIMIIGNYFLPWFLPCSAPFHELQSQVPSEQDPGTRWLGSWTLTNSITRGDGKVELRRSLEGSPVPTYHWWLDHVRRCDWKGG